MANMHSYGITCITSFNLGLTSAEDQQLYVLSQ